MKKIIALIVLLFFICAPSLGAADKATELIDEAITLLNVGLTGITITQQDIFLIKDLKTWAKESGMEKSLSELKDKNAFVLVKEPGARTTALGPSKPNSKPVDLDRRCCESQPADLVDLKPRRALRRRRSAGADPRLTVSLERR